MIDITNEVDFLDSHLNKAQDAYLDVKYYFDMLKDKIEETENEFDMVAKGVYNIQKLLSENEWKCGG